MEVLQTLPSTRQPSPTPSDSSFEFIFESPPPSPDVSTSSDSTSNDSTSSDSDYAYIFPPRPKSYSPAEAAVINDRISKAQVINDRLRKERALRRSARQLIRLRERLESLLRDPEALTADDRNRNEIAQVKQELSSLYQKLGIKRKIEKAKRAKKAPQDVSSVQQWNMKRELKRAKRTQITPDMIQTIEIPNHWQEEIDNEPMESTDYRAAVRDTRPNAFAGKTVIQDSLGAERQSLSEYTNAAQPNDSGRHSFHVDAAVSVKNNMTGLAVVYRTHRQSRAPPWTAKGYRIHQSMDQNEAEAWAIWQALISILETLQNNRNGEHSQTPWSVVAIYSDSQAAVGKIGKGSLKNKRLMREIAFVSRQLSQMQVEIELHWEPGHCNIPGNELADIVAKKARLPP
ncbi:MAG: hypothetical protein Q9195_006886 [Heterodermia aff. obscurata]